MKTYLIDLPTRLSTRACLGEALAQSRACLAVVLLRAGRSRAPLALIVALSLLPAGRVTAQTFTTLHSFTAPAGANATNSDGAGPIGGLTVSGNTLFGTAYSGGSSGEGTVFAINTDGTVFTNLHSFTDPAGANPTAGLILSGNTLYGTSIYGGGSHGGAVFAVNTDGSGFTNLIGLGFYPHAGVILSDNVLYGTLIQGSVFAVHTDGTGYTNLHSFTGGSDGSLPYASLVLSGNTLYGTASADGSSGGGTLFAVNTDGTGFTNVHSLNALSDGAGPFSGLNLSGNTLYGTAYEGGSSGNGTVFAVNSDGTGFTNLHSFTALDQTYNTNSDGANPFAGLILSGNTLYGTTQYGGSSHSGTVFAIQTDGTGFSTLHSFTGGSDGASPQGQLILSGNTLYGTTYGGGSSGHGTVFSLSFRPQLTINSAGTNVVLSWPISYAGFSYAGYYLQQTADLASQGGWVSVVDTNPPVIINGQIRVTTPMLGPQWSYRLAR